MYFSFLCDYKLLKHLFMCLNYIYFLALVCNVQDKQLIYMFAHLFILVTQLQFPVGNIP